MILFIVDGHRIGSDNKVKNSSDTIKNLGLNVGKITQIVFLEANF